MRSLLLFAICQVDDCHLLWLTLCSAARCSTHVFRDSALRELRLWSARRWTWRRRRSCLATSNREVRSSLESCHCCHSCVLQRIQLAAAACWQFLGVDLCWDCGLVCLRPASQRFADCPALVYVPVSCTGGKVVEIKRTPSRISHIVSPLRVLLSALSHCLLQCLRFAETSEVCLRLEADLRCVAFPALCSCSLLLPSSVWAVLSVRLMACLRAGGLFLPRRGG
jgi:hypothetical protein